MLSMKKAKKAASVRGAAQALDLTGAIAGQRLRKIRSRTVGEALSGDWARLGGDLRYVTTRWACKLDG